MMVYEKNLSALEEIYPNIEVALLGTAVLGARLEIVDAKNGEPTAKQNGVFLHSRLDPEREAKRLIESVEKAGCTVFFGLGLGYYVEEFSKAFPDRPAIVVEPDLATFRVALNTRDLADIFSSRHITLLLGIEPDALGKTLNYFPAESIAIVAPKSLVRLNEEYYTRLRGVVAAYTQRREINRNTLRRFGRRWIRNLVGNLHLLPRGRKLLSLENLFAGVPALVIAAGPSLDAVLEHLPEFYRRFIIVAVDTSLRAVLRTGVVPDFLVVVDPQYWNARHLDGCDTRRTILITESATYPAVFRKSYRAVFFGDSLFPLGTRLEEGLGPFGKLGAGGSVATSAWDVSRLLGCSPIVTAGLDLGFPGRSTHFKGGRFEQMQLNSAHRFFPAETGSYAMLNDADPYYEESNSGEPVLTDKRLIVYKWWFENQLKMHPDLHCLNLSAGGLKIGGMDYASPDELLAFPCLTEKEKIMADLVAQPPPGEVESRIGVMMSSIRRLKGELKGLHTLASAASDSARRMATATGEDRNILTRELEKLDNEFLSSSVKDVAGFLVQDLAQSIIQSPRSSSIQDVIAKSLQMYSELAESAAYHLQLLDKLDAKCSGTVKDIDAPCRQNM